MGPASAMNGFDLQLAEDGSAHELQRLRQPKRRRSDDVNTGSKERTGANIGNGPNVHKKKLHAGDGSPGMETDLEMVNEQLIRPWCCTFKWLLFSGCGGRTGEHNTG